MKFERFALPVNAALAGIVSFTMLGMIVNGVYTVAHAIIGRRYVWGYWSMRCDRVDHPLLHGLLAGVVVMLGVVGYRMLSSNRDRVTFLGKSVVGLALLMLPLWDAVCLVGYLVQDATGSLMTQFFPFAGGELAWLSYGATGSVYALLVPVVATFTVLLVSVVKELMPVDIGWGRSIMTSAALGAIMVIMGTIFWSMVTVRMLNVLGIAGV